MARIPDPILPNPAGRVGAAATPAYRAPDVSVAVIEDGRTPIHSRISWGAVLSGIVVTLAVSVLLYTLGAGIGLSTIDPIDADSPTLGTFSTMAAFWYVITGLVASFAGGYTAARLSGRWSASTHAWHGLVTWAATMLLVVMLMANSIGALIGGTARMAGGAIGGIGLGGAAAAAPAFNANGQPVPEARGAAMGAFDALQMRISEPRGPMENIVAQVTELSSGSNNPDELRALARNSLMALLASDPAQAQAAREQAVTALARASNMPRPEAEQRIDAIVQDYRTAMAQAEQRARQAADAAAKAASTAALLGTLAMLLGALSGWLGGLAATPGRRFSLNPMIRRDETTYVA